MSGEATRRWQQVRELFDRIVDLPGAERQAQLAEACAGDPGLRREVEELLAADAEETDGGDILDAPGGGLLAGAERPSLVGTVVGGFTLRRLLGKGGMGAVYEAEQATPKRRVALKVMGQGLLDEAAVRRFRYEAEILGRLQHEGIAQVYAAGTELIGSQEVPFFAMELVEDGQELCAYAKSAGLSLRARLELMLEVCAAVQYGHQRGVIHRDLKPANILVDGQGRAKIIDFGIARCTDVDQQSLSLQTRTGLLLGTLHFMSPEQVRGQQHEVDARSDVYSLGVVLYQLLTGSLPHELTESSLPEAGRVICEEEPPPPERLDRRLRGDLSTILGTAMAKDPSRRYSSVAELRRDLCNYLGDLPITARPPSSLYQLRKFARRHTALLASGLVLVLMLLAGLVVVGMQNLRVQRERDKAQLLGGYLREVLSSAEAIAGKGPGYTVREALDAAALRLKGALDGQPELEAEMREVLGVTYMRLSLYKDAEPHLLRFAELAESLGSELQVRAGLHLAQLRMHQDRPELGLSLSEAAVQVAAASFAKGDARLQEARLERARFLVEDARFAAAEPILTEVLAQRQKEYGAGHEQTRLAQLALGSMFVAAAKPAQAAPILEPLLQDEALPVVPGLRLQLAWGRVLRQRGELPSALEFIARAHEGLRKRLGPEHRDTLEAAFQLIWLRLMQGQVQEQAEFAAATLAACDKVLGRRHAHTRKLLRMVGGIRMQKGELAEGAELFMQAYRAAVEDKGAGDEEALELAGELAFVRYRQGKAQAALALCDQVLSELAGKDSRYGAQCLMVRGLVRAGQKDFERAEQDLSASLVMYERGRGKESYEVRGVLQCQLQMYQAWPKPERAQQVQARIRSIDAARGRR